VGTGTRVEYDHSIQRHKTSLKFGFDIGEESVLGIIQISTLYSGLLKWKNIYKKSRFFLLFFYTLYIQFALLYSRAKLFLKVDLL
jgi:hypothetical protein